MFSFDDHSNSITYVETSNDKQLLRPKELNKTIQIKKGLIISTISVYIFLFSESS